MLCSSSASTPATTRTIAAVATGPAAATLHERRLQHDRHGRAGRHGRLSARARAARTGRPGPAAAPARPARGGSGTAGRGGTTGHAAAPRAPPGRPASGGARTCAIMPPPGAIGRRRHLRLRRGLRRDDQAGRAHRVLVALTTTAPTRRTRRRRSRPPRWRTRSPSSRVVSCVGNAFHSSATGQDNYVGFGAKFHPNMPLTTRTSAMPTTSARTTASRSARRPAGPGVAADLHRDPDEGDAADAPRAARRPSGRSTSTTTAASS